MKLKKDLEEVKNESFAAEILRDYKVQNKRLFTINKMLAIIWVVTFLTLVGTCVYLVYLLNDIGTIEETTTVTQDNPGGDNNYIGNNGDIDNG